jgi:hypothetical protein
MFELIISHMIAPEIWLAASLNCFYSVVLRDSYKLWVAIKEFTVNTPYMSGNLRPKTHHTASKIP